VFLSQYLWSYEALFSGYATLPKINEDTSQDDWVIDIYAVALWTTGFCMIGHLEILGYFRQFMFKLYMMVASLIPLGVFALVFVAPLNSIFWFNQEKNWTQKAIPTLNFRYQIAVTLQAVGNSWGFITNQSWITNWWRVCLTIGIFMLNTLILMNFLVSFTSNALKAANLISAQEEQSTKLRYILDSLEVIRFMQCRKKAPVPYIKKLAGTSGLDSINERS
jgi:hypothetical protein